MLSGQSAPSSLGRWHRLDVKDGIQQTLNNLGLALLSRCLNLLDLLLGLSVGLGLGLLVALAMLQPVSAYQQSRVSISPSTVGAENAYLALKLLVLLLFV